MYSKMIEGRGPIPEDLLTFGQILQNLNLECTEGIFRGTVVGTDNSVALIFASDTMIEAFSRGSSFSVDGTFDVRPC